MRVVVYFNRRSELDRLFEFLNSNGFKWNSGDSLIASRDNYNYEETCHYYRKIVVYTEEKCITRTSDNSYDFISVDKFIHDNRIRKEIAR